jgi:hypothetical protein
MMFAISGNLVYNKDEGAGSEVAGRNFRVSLKADRANGQPSRFVGSV